MKPVDDFLIPHQECAINSADAVADLYERVVDLRDGVVDDDELEAAFAVKEHR